MFVIFRCSAGESHGWGNIKRLLLIFYFLKKKKKFKYIFLINGTNKVNSYLKKSKIKFINLNNKNENSILQNLPKINLSIIELLDCKLSIQKLYKKFSEKVVILDDITKKKYIPDILISCQKKSHKIKKAKYTKFYSGLEYFPISKKIENFLKKKKSIYQKIKNIVVFLGGSAYEANYFKILKLLSKFNFNIFVIIGNETRKNFVTDIKKLVPNIKIYINTENFPRIIFNSDLVISGGGYTKIECAYLKTPVIPISIHRHQNDLIENFIKEFKLSKLNSSEYSTKKFEMILNKFGYNKRKKLSMIFEKKFRINGVHKLISLLLNEKA